MRGGAFDLDAYLARIGWSAPVRHDLATLAGLQEAHMRHIPFENLDVLLGRPVRLDLPGVQQKLVRARRGGYCFEQVTLFAAALEALGFAPQRHAARVVRYLPRDRAPRTHMFLTVPLSDGRYVVDPGLGGAAPRRPIPLQADAPIAVGSDVHWLHREERQWVLRLRSRSGQPDEETHDLWLSPIEPDIAVDFEMGNHYTSTYPQSIFRQNLLLRALTPDGRISVRNRDLTVERGMHIERRQLADRDELRALLQEHFGFDLPEVETLNVPLIPEWQS